MDLKKHFRRQISAKLMQILKAEEERIDVLLAAQVTFFMPARYAFINAAYKMIGNFEVRILRGGKP